MSTVRLGLIGCGRVAEERHVPALRHVSGIRIQAVADPDRARAKRLADRQGVAQRFDDYRALLVAADLDAVAVLTPTPAHAEIVTAALAAGKHVLVEKPLALDADGCDRMLDAAARSTARVVVGFNLRQHRLVRRARDIVSSGALGRIRAVRSVYTHDRSGKDAPDWHRKLAKGGGVTFNEAVHHFDLWRFLLGGDVSEIYCRSLPSSVYEDESSAVCATLSNGALATGTFVLRSSPTSEVEIFGEQGRLFLSCYRFDGLSFTPHDAYPGDLQGRLKEASRALVELPSALRVLRRGGDFQDSFRGLWQHFVDCICEDRQPECTLADGKRAVEMATAAVSSARSNRPVRLTSVR